MAFTPHSKDDIKSMLATIGVDSIDDLFDEIPKDLLCDGLDADIVPAAIGEMAATREFNAIAAQDEAGFCFIGAGAYDHFIPAAVWDIVSRGEFLTAYTPYQAEASQGTLQVIYEYQTMMASLMGLEVSNASMYDGATALAEAIMMAIRLNRKVKSKKVLIPGTLHPHYRKTVQTLLKNQGVEIIELLYCTELGNIPVSSLNRFTNDKSEDIAAVVIAQPNFFGILENCDGLTDWAHQHNALAIACVNPLAMALIKEPGSWGSGDGAEMGVDIACGSGQPFGTPLTSGGPYFGFLCCKQKHVRQMPGRIVGRTVDANGKIGFTLTLQPREQHIRRAKATSNICTNQGLLATAATIYLSLMGPEGLKRVATVCHSNTRKLIKGLTTIEGVSTVFSGPYFHEAVIRLPNSADVDSVIEQLAQRGIQAGFSLKKDYPALGECLLLCATETKTEADLNYYKEQLQHVLAGETTC